MLPGLIRGRRSKSNKSSRKSFEKFFLWLDEEIIKNFNSHNLHTFSTSHYDGGSSRCFMTQLRIDFLVLVLLFAETPFLCFAIRAAATSKHEKSSLLLIGFFVCGTRARKKCEKTVFEEEKRKKSIRTETERRKVFFCQGEIFCCAVELEWNKKTTQQLNYRIER